MFISHDARYPSRRSPVIARNIVSASHPLATQAGLSALAIGGNAVDAALSAAITLVVVEPTGNGLGSDAFCILWDGESLHGLNASGRSPVAWGPDRFAGRDVMPFRGWESVTVPGAVSAWVDISERFGRLPFETLFAPAIRYARDGFHVTPVIAETWRRGAAELATQPGFAEAFMPDGRAPRAGELFRLPALARSLELIAYTNGRTFYEGELAKRIADFAQTHGSALTIDDLSAHKNDWCGTINAPFAGADIHEIPPNGQGIAALMALRILATTHFAELEPDTVAALHLQIEAMKLAFGDLYAYVADTGAMRKVTPAALLDPDYLSERAKAIDPRRAQSFGAGAPRTGGTVYLCAADDKGMMVSFIQSNYSGFGSGVVVPGTGISLQNRGRRLLAEARPSELCGPRETPSAHDHPCLRNARRPARNRFRGDGRPDAGAGAHADRGADAQLGSGPADRRRRAALAIRERS